ncbi:MAG: ABC transporter permease [Prevotella sp.]|nr:ABC transporter permease [Prevotella sp.]
MWAVMVREMRILWKNPIYGFCMVVFPIMVVAFFTSMMEAGAPEDLPIGIVDADNTTTTRTLARRLDAFQSTKIVDAYPTVAEARHAMQRNEIFGFLYFPKGTTEKLMAGRQPTISYYYSMAAKMSGSLVMKDLKVISTLGSAAVGQATLRARGATDAQIQTFLQPIAIDLHMVANPWSNYNVYLSTVFVPGIIMLFVFLITAYSIGTELKFQRSREWVETAGGNMLIAILGKFLPQTLIWLAVFLGFEYYFYGVVHFPYEGGAWQMVLLAFMAVGASQGFGVFAFGLMPSLRMSMSICSLWAVLSLSMAGSAFPVMGMDTPLQSLSWLFPLRHYYMVYQISVFNGYPLLESWFHFAALAAFMLLPWLVVGKIKNAMLNYVYIP